MLSVRESLRWIMHKRMIPLKILLAQTVVYCYLGSYISTAEISIKIAPTEDDNLYILIWTKAWLILLGRQAVQI